MPASFEDTRHHIPSILGAGALSAWLVAYVVALPRLLAGPLCASPRDAFTLAGHCPACGVAAALTLAFVASLALARSSAPGPARLARPLAR